MDGTRSVAVRVRQAQRAAGERVRELLCDRKKEIEGTKEEIRKRERERERDRPMTMSSLLLRILLAFSLLFVSSDSASDVDSKYYEDGGSGGEQDEDGSDEYSPRESQYRCACASII